MNCIWEYVYTDTYVHAVTVDEKKRHGFERERRGIYGEAWREDRREQNVVIKIESQKEEEDKARERTESGKTGPLNWYYILNMERIREKQELGSGLGVCMWSSFWTEC